MAKQWIFNGDETTFYWKKMLFRTSIAREGKSLTGFKVSKDRLISQLHLVILSWSQCSFTIPKILEPLRIYSAVIYKWNNKAWMKAYLFTTWFIEYFKPTIWDLLLETKAFQNTTTVHWQCSYYPRAQTEMKLMLFSCLLTQHPFIWLKSCSLRSKFYMAIAASDWSGQSQLKTL